ncbi:substrate-binding domain-containing protein [Streptomyces sp. NPDC014889]|uniref:substrate-binding domain-containing protein n=1 Tax=Streptomyces sp. NPDC014889 TaxID=3364928 RepID=UPI0036FB0B5C
MRQGLFDMGFLMEAETRHPGVQTEVLGSESLTVLAAPDHPLTRAEKVTTEDLRGVQVISAEAGCAYRELFEAELNDGTGESLPFLEFGTIESIKRGVAAGLGVSLLPTATVADFLERGTLVALPWPIPFEVFTQIAWRRGKTLTRGMRVFIDQAVRFLSEEYAH